MFWINVVRQFRVHIRADQQAACQPDRQPEDVYEIKGTVLNKATPGDEKVIFEHSWQVWIEVER